MNNPSRRQTLRSAFVSAAALALGGSGEAAGIAIDPKQFSADIISAPENPADWPLWLARLNEWRSQMRRKLNYSDALYQRDDFAWVPRCFACCFVMMCDQTFYDHQRGRYTIDEFLDAGHREFGGFDSIVLWHAYPRIGLDDRNQFDFYRDMPGGLDGLRQLTRDCHRRGVRVFVDYNPWDTGTRREGISDIDALMTIIAAIEADGIFLDTMNRGAAEFRRKLDATRRGVVLEGEGALPLENVHDHHMSWAQGFADGRIPGVLRNKFFERRHMQHQINRWSRGHWRELHTAWMNGSGMMVWENVFGSWVGWCERDKATLRSMLPIQRRYWRLFAEGTWTPLQSSRVADLYASLWEGDHLRLWTIVNRSDKPIEGRFIDAELRTGETLYDLIAGRPVSGPMRIGPRGIGAILATTRAAAGDDFDAFLKGQGELARRARLDTTFPARVATLTRPQPTVKRAKDNLPTDMVAIPAAELTMLTEFWIRESGFYEPQDDHLNGGGFHPLHRPKIFERKASLSPYALDLTPVTNAQFAEFLRASAYRPRIAENFLKHWRNGRPPANLESHPVVYVDLDDAQAYAKWAGKRLPTEEEWQYAAQGPQALLYPWGNEFQADRCNAGQNGGTTPVKAFPAGRSPFGLYGMCGNTWEWTESERQDGRTRFCILKGGSWYTAKGSGWYFEGGPRPCRFAAKMLLTWPGLDRCATIGFRCAVDVE